ncbi:hypothetical protein [Mycolicibacterium tusciae]|uniref:hypothetical protein n=1 Tax=Mycolicibacterium tusciae TaxID=75922 RepID=UPI001F40BD30|nr:hypothetical protein [Mycolicibacterium tusciae]
MAVGLGRNLRPLPRIGLHRTPDFEQRAELNRSPPAIRLEHALIDVVSGELHDKDLAAAFAVQARVCASRRTTPQRILRVLATRQRVSGRRTFEAMLADLRDGACSVLERGYLLRVERAHGLPRGERQTRDRDALRDLAELSRSGLVTTRVTHGLVFDDACRTAVLIGGLLRRRGWTGRMRTCPVCRPALALTG